MAPLLLFQALYLVKTLVMAVFRALLDLPAALIRCTLHDLGVIGFRTDGACDFYEGTVTHVRLRPETNAFTYKVRMAVVDLDTPPSWWAQQAHDHWTADQARHFASTEGGVKLLTHPISSGYTQNPISVYYCYEEDGSLNRCIAEVTNTPWGDRVRFLFRLQGEVVPKALHVSPFMDMDATWTLKASEPRERLHLSVRVSHPRMGDFFSASLAARKCHGTNEGQNEASGLSTLFRYGYQPHRVAFWIYWQAIKLFWMGIPFFSPPSRRYRDEVCGKATHPKGQSDEFFVWRDTQEFPWSDC
eukprot:evm.model.scf_672.1 EVM.evm.TU.scf_672.1   scf_672:490-3697(-)